MAKNQDFTRPNLKNLRFCAFNSILTLASCSISSSEICPPSEYHTTAAIPNTADNTHLSRRKPRSAHRFNHTNQEINILYIPSHRPYTLWMPAQLLRIRAKWEPVQIRR